MDHNVPFGKEKVITCYGIIGTLSLATSTSSCISQSSNVRLEEVAVVSDHADTGFAADFLLIITARTPSCRLLSHPIYLATDFRLLPLSPLSTSSAILDHPVERELISLVEQGLRSARLWFSYGWDVTNSLQRQLEQEEKGTGAGKIPMWQRADDRFFWNRFLSQRMIDSTEKGGADVGVCCAGKL